MTTYTTIADADIDPESPGTTTLFTRLRDNPIAITEGASGAPNVDPINAMAHQGAVGAIGTYAFLRRTTLSGAITQGSTYAGSGLDYAGVYSTASGNSARFAWTTTSPAGTWRAMGNPQTAASNYGGTLFLRIS